MTLARLYHTLRPLKWRQLWHLAFGPLGKRMLWIRKQIPEDALSAAHSQPRFNAVSLAVPRTYFPAEHQFCFLNTRQTFPEKIDWYCRSHGLLWLFNLHYFEWLYDDSLSVEERLQTMRSFAGSTRNPSILRHPYPASLRTVSWIRFLLRYSITDRQLTGIIYADADLICRFPEYRLDGNHLWENGCALVCAGAFFKSPRFQKKGADLLLACLKEQLYPDGGHKEGSAMYHSLLLWRLMQSIELLRATGHTEEAVTQKMTMAARSMLGWLQQHTFSDGTTPAFNDATEGIAPTPASLCVYAAALRITAHTGDPQAVAYPVVRAAGWELMIDAAGIAPAWQPGHAHAGTSTFCLHAGGKPLVVDTGISTYENTPRRNWERSTDAHNALCVSGYNSSDVWKSFRVGRRARVTKKWATDKSFIMTHDGYRNLGIMATRQFEWDNDRLVITDTLKGKRRHPLIIYIFIQISIWLRPMNLPFGAVTFL